MVGRAAEAAEAPLPSWLVGQGRLVQLVLVGLGAVQLAWLRVHQYRLCST